MASSRFLRAMHPKTEIRPTAEAIAKILAAGWVAQIKIHGHRAQIHIPPSSLSASPAGSEAEILAYNRQGQFHKRLLPASIQQELRRLFAPSQDWTVIDAEWLKPEEKLYLFDLLRVDGTSLSRLSFAERWKQLPRAYISPSIQTLGLLTNVNQCLEVLERPEKWVEGLVFKSPSPGFEDSSIIRCRKPGSRGV